MSILDELAAYARIRTRRDQKKISLEEMKEKALKIAEGEGEFTFPFEQALKKPGLAMICECKKASPSKGLIAPDFPYLEIAREYEAAGADAISVLTEPKWFLGYDQYLENIAKEVRIPVLRKDFIVDPYMIYQAKVLGASAVLLICAILTPEELRQYHALADSLGLSAVVEAHDRKEIEMAVDAGARIIGVNNRNLKDFSVDVHNAGNLSKYIPEDIILISESGMHQAQDVKAAYDSGAKAVLIGESLMKAPDKKAKMKELKSLLPEDSR